MSKKATALTTALFSLLFPVFSHAQDRQYVLIPKLEARLGFHSESSGDRDATGLNTYIRYEHYNSLSDQLFDFFGGYLQLSKHNLNVEQAGVHMGTDKPFSLEASVFIGSGEEGDYILEDTYALLFGPYVEFTKATLAQDIVKVNHNSKAIGIQANYIKPFGKGDLNFHALYANGTSNNDITINLPAPLQPFNRSTKEPYSKINMGIEAHLNLESIRLGTAIDWTRKKTGDAVQTQLNITPVIEIPINYNWSFSFKCNIFNGKGSGQEFSGTNISGGMVYYLLSK